MAEVIFLNDINGNPIFGDSRYMGPYVLASQLNAAGYDAVVIDYFTRIPQFFDYLEKFIDSSTLMIGVSTTFLSRHLDVDEMQVYQSGRWSRDKGIHVHRERSLWLDSEKDLIEWFQRLRELVNKYNPKCKIVLGGGKSHWAFYGLETFHEVDFIALSHASECLVEFIRSLRSGDEPDFYLYRGKKVIDNKETKDKEFCPKTIFSKKWGVKKKESLPIEISRGCAFNCKFCTFPKEGSFRKDLNILKGEFQRNFELFGATVYHFCDDCFNDSRVKVEETCNMLLSLPFKIEWVSYARVDVAVKFPDTMRLMVESGAKGLYFGLESFNLTVARNAGKGTPTEKVKEFLSDSYNKYGDQCFLQGSFIVGLPGETEDSQRETINWVAENKALHFLDVGVLEVPFANKTYNLVGNLSDYSKSPEKYGFLNVSVMSNEWEHETMNSQTARILTDEFVRAWYGGGKCMSIRGIFSYPILRTLGYSELEIRKIVSSSRDEFFEKEAKIKFQVFLNDYWNGLVENKDEISE